MIQKIPEREKKTASVVSSAKPEVIKVEKATAPLGQKSTNTKFSIDKQLHPPQEEAQENVKEEDPSQLPKNHFSETDLQTQWSKFLAEIRERDSILYSAIYTFKVVKKDEQTIVLHYPSESAKVIFDKIQGEFLNHFKRIVNNYSIKAEYVKDAKLKQEILTKRKLFDKMAEINPLLRTLDDLMKFDFSS